MSLEENKAIVRRLIEATNEHDLSSIGNLMAPDYVDHTRDYAKKGAIYASKMLLASYCREKVSFQKAALCAFSNPCLFFS